jgi:fructokinase
VSSNAIVTVGENLVDVFNAGAGSPLAVPGGGPFNVARTIARLGQTSIFLSGTSNDAYGQMLRRTLKDDGVVLLPSDPVDRPTSLANVELSDEGPRYNFHLDGTAAFEVDINVADAQLAAVGDVAALYVGTLGLLVEPMASTCEHVVLSAPPTTLVVLDPNCRPSAISDEIRYRTLLDRLFSRSDVVKVSTEDLDYLAPMIPIDQAARSVLAKGATYVVVTDGPRYVRVFTQGDSMTVDVPEVDVIDTVGAGDALVGGFLAWWVGHGLRRTELANEELVRSAIEAAVVIASSTCARRGAEPPWANEVREHAAWRWL